MPHGLVRKRLPLILDFEWNVVRTQKNMGNFSAWESALEHFPLTRHIIPSRDAEETGLMINNLIWKLVRRGRDKGLSPTFFVLPSYSMEVPSNGNSTADEDEERNGESAETGFLRILLIVRSVWEYERGGK